MRAHAPFSTLLATTALLFVALMLPFASAAKTAKHPISKQPKAAQHGKPVRPRSNVHKVARHQRHVSLLQSSRRHAPLGSAAKADDATSDRVHAWVKNQENTSLAKPAQPAAAKQISAIGTVGDASTPGANKPQMLPIEDMVAEPVVLPTLYNRRGRLIVPPALKGSHEILIRQNEMADSEGLDRVRDDDDLERLRRAGMLVAIPTNNTLHTDDRLPANRRYCRPWTALFLDTLARQHYAHFQSALQVNSAVRTVEFQQRLIHTNANAAPAEGDTASPHLTGQAIDIAKHGLSMAEIAWLRGYLLPLVQQGKVDVEEEFQQSCFHISVYKKYMPAPAADRRVIATTHREGIGALGMSLR